MFRIRLGIIAVMVLGMLAWPCAAQQPSKNPSSSGKSSSTKKSSSKPKTTTHSTPRTTTNTTTHSTTTSGTKTGRTSSSHRSGRGSTTARATRSTINRPHQTMYNVYGRAGARGQRVFSKHSAASRFQHAMATMGLHPRMWRGTTAWHVSYGRSTGWHRYRSTTNAGAAIATARVLRGHGLQTRITHHRIN